MSSASRRYGLGLTHAFVDEIEYYEDHADGLRSVVASGLENGIAVMRAHHPALATASDDEIRAIGVADARLVLAREHGFASWAQFRRHVAGLAESGEPFRRAFKAIEARESRGARRAARRPLPRPRHGTRHERQRPARAGRRRAPLAADSCASCSRAARIRAAPTIADGRRSIRPATATTASWPGAARGRRTHGPLGPRGGRHAARGSAVLGQHRGRGGARGARGRALQPARRRRPRPARPDPLARPRRRRPERSRGAARGFYRPTGFPTWEPSGRSAGDPRRGARVGRKSDRAKVLGPLVELGADSNADPYRGTALIWAGACGHVARSGGWSSSAPSRAAAPRSAAE